MTKASLQAAHIHSRSDRLQIFVCLGTGIMAALTPGDQMPRLLVCRQLCVMSRRAANVVMNAAVLRS